MSTHAPLICRRLAWRRLVRLVAVFTLVPSTALACLWDYDTLRQERSKFPEVLELITGKFLRHSPEFYEWRIKDRTEKLKTDPTNLAYHDDLAVAYSKVGRTKDAIATMEAKEKLKPGLYETYSNLGTFYILAGEFEKGLPYIDKALAINPDAHFGREKYQKWLVEYALSRKDKQGKIEFPLKRDSNSGLPDELCGTFYDYLRHRLELEPDYPSDDHLKEAVRGILGMMRFANHDNPLLLETLGDLLRYGYTEDLNDAKMLAARSYLQVSKLAKKPEVRKAYRGSAALAINFQFASVPKSAGSIQLEIDDVEKEFAAEQADADRWYAELRAREIGWIRDGKNADAEFDRLYTEEPQLPLTGPELHPDTPRTIPVVWQRTFGVAFGLAGLIAVVAIYRRRAKRSA